MNLEELALEHQETKDRSIRNEGRIKKLEESQSVLHELVTSVGVMAEQIKNMAGSMEALTGKVDKLEEKPGKRWETIVNNAIWAVLGAFILYILKQLGL